MGKRLWRHLLVCALACGLPLAMSTVSAAAAAQSAAGAAPARLAHIGGSPRAVTGRGAARAARPVTHGVTPVATTYLPLEAPAPANAGTNPSELGYDVACAATGSCVAVGQYNTTSGVTEAVTLTLGGGAWRAAQAPLPSDANTSNPGAFLDGVTCPTTAFCVAGGGYTDMSGNFPALVETWNGTAWTPTRAVLPANAGPANALLAGASCLSPTSCYVAGWYVDSSGHTQGLVETLGGTTWTPTEIASPSGAATNPVEYFLGMSCPAVGTCYAAGNYNDSSGNGHPLVAALGGSNWNVSPLPLPGSGNTFSQLNSISCASASFCSAAGYYGHSGLSTGLIETLSGGTWSATTPPLPSDAASNPAFGLIGIWCTGAGSCISVGGYSDTTGNSHDVFETLAGGSWNVALAPLPANANSNQQPLTVGGLTESLDGFSCVNPTYCIAVGTYKDTNNNFQGLIEGLLPPANAGAYTPVNPFRVFDSRSSGCVQCTLSGALGAGSSRDIPITGNPSGNGTVPAGATAAVINLTGIAGSQGTFLSLSPTGAPGLGSTSNLNLTAGAIQANLVTVAIGSGGKVTVYNSAGSINVAMDVEGYFMPLTTPLGFGSAGTFHPIAPQRVCDTRSACSGGVVALGAGASRPITVTSASGGIPNDGTATAAVFNLTAVIGSAGTYLTASPPQSDGTCSTPSTSNLNINSGAILPNRVIVPIGTSGAALGKVCIYNSQGSINFIIDVNGWFGNGMEPSAGALFYAVSPQRICDTRSGTATACSGRSISAGSTLTVSGVGTAAGDPTAPVAIVVNTTGILGSAGTFVSLFPDGARPSPLTSDLNLPAGAIVANLVIVGIGNGGNIDVYNDQGTIDTALDAQGWFQ